MEDILALMMQMHQIQPKFQVWERSKEYTGWTIRNEQIPSQPACVFERNGYKILLGDISEWFYPLCSEEKVRTIINLCPEKTDINHLRRAYELGAVVISAPADDSWSYDIVQDVCSDELLDLICHRLNTGSVLISCYAGCNRSAAVTLAILMMRFNMDIVTAFNLLTNRRGRILTNYHFRFLLAKAYLQHKKQMTVTPK